MIVYTVEKTTRSALALRAKIEEELKHRRRGRRDERPSGTDLTFHSSAGCGQLRSKPTFEWDVLELAPFTMRASNKALGRLCVFCSPWPSWVLVMKAQLTEADPILRRAAAS